jgi:hypothetical protein
MTTNIRGQLGGGDDQQLKTTIRKQGDFPKGDNEENQHGCAPIVV